MICANMSMAKMRTDCISVTVSKRRYIVLLRYYRVSETCFVTHVTNFFHKSHVFDSDDVI